MALDLRATLRVLGCRPGKPGRSKGLDRLLQVLALRPANLSRSQYSSSARPRAARGRALERNDCELGKIRRERL